MERIKKFRKDKRGAALIYVIVTASVLLLLGAATTSVAYANLKTTQLQKQADNNFYSADGVMNAMVGGLAETSSVSYENAYTQILTTITDYETVEGLKSQFKDDYLTQLRLSLCDDTQTDETERLSRYSVAKLRKYAEETYSDDYSFSISAQNGENYLDDFDDGLILRNVHITYQNDEGYYDEITTDIKLKTPDIGLKQLPPNPDFFNTLLIANNGLSVESNRGVNLYGDVYAGEISSTDNTSIKLEMGSSCGLYPSHEDIISGDIQLGDNASLIFENWDASDGDENAAASYLWTDNICLGRYSKADLDGNIFVYDDLEVNGSYAKVKLSGSYYGYSNKNIASESSSININGAHTEIDLTELDNLILAGSSFIQTSAITSDQADIQNDTNIQMGEAFSVKSNQIAYLVDDREWKVKTGSNDIEKFVSNPMSYTQYQEMETANGNWDTIKSRIRNRVLTLSGDIRYADYGADIIKIYSPLYGGCVYFYVQFSNADNAAKYFNDVSKNNAETALRLRTYAAQYISNLKLNSTTQLLVNSNYITTPTDGTTVYAGEKATESGTSIQTIIPQNDTDPNGLGYHFDPNAAYRETVREIISQAQSRYAPEEGTGLQDKAKFDDLINIDNLKALIENAANSSIRADENTDITITNLTGTKGVKITGSTSAAAIIVDNADEVDEHGTRKPYVLKGGTGLVIATGDVQVAGDWIGAIVSGGKVTFAAGSPNSPITLQYDQAMVSTVLYLYFRYGTPEKTMAVINIYKGFENYEVAQASQDRGVNEDMIRNCISFSNWAKS